MFQRETNCEYSMSQKMLLRTLFFVSISLLYEGDYFKENKSLSHLIAEAKFSKFPSLQKKQNPYFPASLIKKKTDERERNRSETF